VVQVNRAAGLEIGATTAVDQQRVAGKHMVAPDKAHAAGGVAGGVQRADVFRAKAQGVAVLEQHRCRADATGRWCGGFGTGQFGELSGAGDVVGVSVGFQRPHQLQTIVAQHLQVACDLGVHRINDDRLAADRVKHHIGVGGGCGVKKLDGFHGVLYRVCMGLQQITSGCSGRSNIPCASRVGIFSKPAEIAFNQGCNYFQPIRGLC